LSVGPNVVLVTIDTLRPDHLGCYGYRIPTSPRIDELARQGVLFEQAISNGSYTLSAFPAILSSTYASMYGGTRGRLAPERPLIAESLQWEGYSTAGFTSNPLVGLANGYDRGFDTFGELTPERHQPHWHRMKGVQRFLRRPTVQRALKLLRIEGRLLPTYVSGSEVTEEACRWLDQIVGRFFLWVHYMDAHWPYRLHDRLSTSRDIAQAWVDGLEMHAAFRQRRYPGDRQMERVIRLYDEAIQYADGQVGHLVDRLTERRLLDRTLLIVTSDHGEAFFEHGRYMHGAYYDFHDEILRVPLILRVPGACRSGLSIAGQVCLLDLAPTILEWLGVSPPPEMEGIGLLPLVEGNEGPDRPEHCISEMWDYKEEWSEPWHCAAVRTETHKYIFDSRRPGSRELYNLQADPAESTDVWATEHDTAEPLRAVLEAHMKRVEASSSHPLHEDEEITRRLRGLGYVD
jgi:arylsulfatase A-like enzyme